MSTKQGCWEGLQFIEI